MLDNKNPSSTKNSFNLVLAQDTSGHPVGTRVAARHLREQAEEALAKGLDVVFDFSGVPASESFIDELIGMLILLYGPDVANSLIFTNYANEVLALLDFVAADRCDLHALLASTPLQGTDEDQLLTSRLNHFKHCLAFRHLPLDYVEDALSRMKPRPAKAGEIIVTQGDLGVAFYMLWSGRAEVWGTGVYDDVPFLIDDLVAGDTFGDEALVMGGSHNITVKMVEDGELLMLSLDDFRDYVSSPLLDEVSPKEAHVLLQNGWSPVDVRYTEEFERDVLPH